MNNMPARIQSPGPIVPLAATAPISGGSPPTIAPTSVLNEVIGLRGVYTRTYIRIVSRAMPAAMIVAPKLRIATPMYASSIPNTNPCTAEICPAGIGLFLVRGIRLSRRFSKTWFRVAAALAQQNVPRIVQRKTSQSMPSGLARMKPAPVVTTTSILRRSFDKSPYRLTIEGFSVLGAGVALIGAVSSIEPVSIPIPMTNKPNQSVARILTLALGATTAMWVFSYIALLFSGKTGGEVLFVLAALCIPVASRHAKSRTEGAWIGFVSALINLLLIGSIVGGQAPGDMLSLGAMWAGGLFVGSIALGVVGSLFHGQLKDCTCEMDWHVGFLAVASTLVFLMLITGGLVTGMEAGLAVPDWPNSYGHNMLLYPLTEMVVPGNEGVFFEHAHRLTGMLIGLTSLMMVVCVWKWNTCKYVRLLALLIFIFVCLQGLLGGLRVTGYLTLSQDREMLSPNLWIGVVHGVVGQMIFAGFVMLSAMMSPRWRSPEKNTNKGDATWATMLCVAMVLQLILGAMYRHMMGDETLAPKATHILYTHIAVAILVLLCAIVTGVRCMGRETAILKKLGISLHVLVLLQLLLGGGALLVMLINKGNSVPLYEVIVTTLHQANGALLLGASFATFVWVRRMMS